MRNKKIDWLEETWKIKKQIAQETKNMSFIEYWNYLEKLSDSAKKGMQIHRHNLKSINHNHTSIAAG